MSIRIKDDEKKNVINSILSKHLYIGQLTDEDLIGLFDDFQDEMRKYVNRRLTPEESKLRQNIRSSEYIRNRYKNDPDFREKMKSKVLSKYVKKKDRQEKIECENI